MQLKDLKVVVTGGASGLGRCFVKRFAESGAAVFAVDLDAAGLESLSHEHQGIVTHVADISSEDAVVAMMDAAFDELGHVNGLVNNAGIFRDALLVSKDRKTGGFKKMSLADWQKVIDVDLTGPFLCTRELVLRMLEREVGPGVIVNISSVSRAGNRGQTNYSAAKAGLVADTKLWAEELARYSIRVGAVAPGFIDTPILQAMRPEVLDKLLTGIPLGRAGAPDEIYQAVKFIVECDYFTGRCVDVDGGLTV